MMINYREILRLNSLGYSQRQIERGAKCSHHTVKRVIERAQQLHLEWPLAEDITDAMLDNIFSDRVRSAGGQYAEPDYAYIHKELAKPGVTLALLWNEYCAKCYANGETPYMSTQFGERYRRWAKVTKATMRIQHKPGDAMQVDWAGTTIPYYDSVTGEGFKAYLFVAVLPCSCFAYAEARDDMKQENWLLCHVHAYEYFGGATRLLIPDNLKTGVTANTRYETRLNESYRELAEHYGTAVIPARVRRPKDKSLAEGTVKYASTWIIAALRDRKFFSIPEVRAAVAEKLEELNDRPFQKREGTRRSAYCNEEKEYMLPLPVYPYEPAIWSTAVVGSDYLVSDGKNKYSVPFDLIGERVQIRLTKNTVEIFFGGSRAASHHRLSEISRYPIIKPEHMPREHRRYLEYDSETFIEKAAAIGENTLQTVRCFLSAGSVPEQGYKNCASLLRLADKYGADALETACEQTLGISSSPSVRTINSILKNRPPRPEHTDEPRKADEKYGITRGSAYFRKGGDGNA